MQTADTNLSSGRQEVAGEGDHRSSQVRELVEELEVVAESDDLSLMHDRLAEIVGGLKSCADSMEHDETASAEEVRSELTAVQERLQEAESLAARDCLTGLANRREAEKSMLRRIQAGRPFCIILFDLDNFKQVNDRHGHRVGDYVLKAFSNRLSSQFRSADVACRWGGDEFLVILDAALPEARGKASLVAERLSGPYAMNGAGEAVRIGVSASFGVAQHEPGETGEELFARADALLYLHKWESSPPGHVQDAAEVGGFTILVADDEERIRVLAGEVLRRHGYNVLQAADGVEALELAAQHPGPIHLLLTDLSMPRLDGRELHRRLSNVRPGTTTLFMSGDLDTGLHPDAAFLPKPFAAAVLVRKVSEALKSKQVDAAHPPAFSSVSAAAANQSRL